MLLHALSLAASVTVFIVASSALNRMGKSTARLIVWAYVSLFAGSGLAAMLSAWEILTGGHAEDSMHLAMLVVIAGLSLLLLSSRRRECLCIDCPARRFEKGGCRDGANNC